MGSKSSVNADLRKNWLVLAFRGIIDCREMEKIYTDVRFGVADLQPEFNVIAEFSECKLMYLRGIKVFKKIFYHILSNKSGEIIRVLQPRRIISRQIINYTLDRPGYKPTYVASREAAEKKINHTARRTSLRFQMHEKTVNIEINSKNNQGYILNISTTGCAISSNTVQPKVGDMLHVDFTLKSPVSKRDFKLEGRVVRVESYTFAIEFSAMADTEKTLLYACLLSETEKEPI